MAIRFGLKAIREFSRRPFESPNKKSSFVRIKLPQIFAMKFAVSCLVLIGSVQGYRSLSFLFPRRIMATVRNLAKVDTSTNSHFLPEPTALPSTTPSILSSLIPSLQPSTKPSFLPSMQPITKPSEEQCKAFDSMCAPGVEDC